MTDDRLAKIVARRHRLTTEEVAELSGRTLSELTVSARRLLQRRAAVEAAKQRHPEVSGFAVEAAYGYDGGGQPVDQFLGKQLAAQMLSDRVRGRNPGATNFLARVGKRALERPDDSDREQRIAERIAAITGKDPE